MFDSCFLLDERLSSAFAYDLNISMYRYIESRHVSLSTTREMLNIEGRAYKFKL